MSTYYERNKEARKAYQRSIYDPAKKKEYDNRPENRERILSQKKEWRENNPDRVVVHKQNTRLKPYNLTEEEYKTKLIEQNYQCSICSTDITDKNHIDHCHKSGKVRGLLCRKCNIGLGMFNDNVECMEKAIEYVKRNNI